MLFKGALTGPSPVDRARTGSKHHLLTDSSGIPLVISLTGGNRNDVTQLLPLVDGVGPVRGKVGRPRQRADRLLADRGYDHDKYRRALRARGVKPVIARRGRDHGSGLGRERWVVERTFAHKHDAPASETARRSSNASRTPSSPTGPSSCTMKVTS